MGVFRLSKRRLRQPVGSARDRGRCGVNRRGRGPDIIPLGTEAPATAPTSRSDTAEIMSATWRSSIAAGQQRVPRSGTPTGCSFTATKLGRRSIGGDRQEYHSVDGNLVYWILIGLAAAPRTDRKPMPARSGSRLCMNGRIGAVGRDTGSGHAGRGASIGWMQTGARRVDVCRGARNGTGTPEAAIRRPAACPARHRAGVGSSRRGRHGDRAAAAGRERRGGGGPAPTPRRGRGRGAAGGARRR